jgi:hypothetical protein
VRVSFAIAVAALALAVSGCTVSRPEDPVVLEGAQVPALAQVATGDVVAFRWVADSWDQVPVQVDERKRMEFTDASNPYLPATLTVFADPNTTTGADPDPNVDADDELAFMAKDLGAEAPGGTADPDGVLPGSGLKLRARSMLSDVARDGWIYLFERSGNLSPGAGEHYVDYDNATAATPYYVDHFSGLWLNDELRIKAGDASEVDLLDRAKVRFYPGECYPTEDYFDRGAFFLANREGPVRAIRSYMGAASGSFTERNHFFYEQREDIKTYLRVHQIPGVMDFFDYAPAATGMRYRNNNNRNGVTIDGNPETITPGKLTWETVDGPQGGLTMVHTVESDIPDLSLSSYYLDDSTPDAPEEVQCTGDSASMGASGPIVDEPMPSTDPRWPPFNSLTATRTIYFEAPGKTDGPRRQAQATSPFLITVSPGP